MIDEHKFGMMMARMVDLIKRSPEGEADHKAALRALVELADKRSWNVRVEAETLTIEGAAVPQEVPFVTMLVSQLKAHRIAEINVAHRASALDLAHLLRALAEQPGDPVEERLAQHNVRTVSVLSEDAAADSKSRRGVRITEALKAGGVLGDSPAPAPQPKITTAGEAAYGEMEVESRGVTSKLGSVVKKLEGQSAGPEMASALNSLRAGILEAVREHRVEEAIEALILVIRQEAQAENEEIKRAYSLAVSRMLQQEVLQPLVKLMLDPLYLRDLSEIFRRAGSKGTQLLLEALIAAQTFAERRAFLEALKHAEGGAEQVIKLLGHHEWFVVRNMADLVGELRMEQGIPALAKAVEHSDDRVRKSAGVALAKIGTSATVPALRKALHDPEPGVRLAVLKAVSGKNMAALAMPLVNTLDTEEDPKLKNEIILALGRIGTPDAVKALAQVAAPGGKLLGRRTSSQRLPAVEALGAAGSKEAKSVLRELAEDRDKTVREAVQKALEKVASQQPS